MRHEHATEEEEKECYPCHLASLNINPGGHKVHAVNGDPWKNNPVADRIEELQAQGRRVAAMEIKETV